MAGRTGPSTGREPRSLHERALGLLSVRARSRSELRRRLLAAGFEAGEVDEELGNLAAVGLIDDAAFARAAVEEATGRRLQGRRAVEASLAAKGVDRATIEQALAASAGDEEARAASLARARAGRFGTLAPDVAGRRLTDLLIRRGYAPALARRAAAAALAVDPDPDDA